MNVLTQSRAPRTRPRPSAPRAAPPSATRAAERARSGLRLARPRVKQKLGALTILSVHGKS